MIDLWKMDPRIRKAVAKHRSRLCTTAINYQELTFGLDPERKKHQEELEFYRTLIASVVLLPHTSETAERAGRLWWDLQKRGHIIGEFDIMIAGALLSNGVTHILTRNPKHFAKVPGLQVLTY